MCNVTQPIVVHGSLGVGRTGCFCTLSVAMDMMELAKESITDAFDDDPNILDQVDTHCYKLKVINNFILIR